MNDPQSLAHTKWNANTTLCGYRSIARKSCLVQRIAQGTGPVLRELARHKESEILEGRFLLDHVHMLIAIPPKYAVAQVVGYIKGKSAIILPELWGTARKLYQRAFLGARLFCLDSWDR